MKIYIGCAITTIPKEKVADFKRFLQFVKSSLTEMGLEILEFKTAINPNASEKEVYEYDIKDCVEVADIMLALCDHPSTGLGYEMATAIEKRGIPVLAVAHTSSEVTKLLRGISHPKFTFARYEKIEDVPKLFEDFLRAKRI